MKQRTRGRRRGGKAKLMRALAQVKPTRLDPAAPPSASWPPASYFTQQAQSRPASSPDASARTVVGRRPGQARSPARPHRPRPAAPAQAHRGGVIGLGDGRGAGARPDARRPGPRADRAGQVRSPSAQRRSDPLPAAYAEPAVARADRIRSPRRCRLPDRVRDGPGRARHGDHCATPVNPASRPA